MRQPALQRQIADLSDLVLGLDEWPEFHDVHMHLHDAQLALESEHPEAIEISSRQLNYWIKRLTEMRDQG